MRRILLAIAALVGLATEAQAQCSQPNYYSGLFHNGCLAASDLNNNNIAIYAAMGASSGSFLPLAGGTLTGGLIGTTATFSGAVIFATPGAGSNSTVGATTNFVTTYFAPKASPTFTGIVTIPTPAPGDSSTAAASTAFVATSFAPLLSPAFTGTPTAPTALAGTNTTQIATTAFVAATPQINAGSLFGNPTGSQGTGSSVALDTSVTLSSAGVFGSSFAARQGLSQQWFLDNSRLDPLGTGFYVADRFPIGVAETTLTAPPLTGTTTVVAARFVTPPGVPGASVYPAGFVTQNIYAAVSGGTVFIQVQVHKLNADGTTLTQLDTYTSASFSNTAVAPIQFGGSHNALGGSPDTLLPNERLVFQIRATRVSGPDPITLTLYFNGTVNASTAGTTVITPRSSVDYQVNVLDAGLKNDMVTGIDGQITAGGSVLTSATVACSLADVTTPAKHFEMNGVGTSITGAPLITTVTGCSGTGFQLAATATLASGRAFLNNPSGADNTAITGNYAIGDLFSFSGGNITGGSATQLRVESVQSAGTLAIVNAGSGGTDGAYTFVGTTGTGNRIRMRGTVTGGVLASVVKFGNDGYITAPTNTADPIIDPTGANPLAGATVSYQLGVDQASIIARGNYLTIPPSPIATTAGSISGATGLTYDPQFVTTNTFMIGTDNTAALTAAITSTLGQMNATGRYTRRILYFPAGNYMIDGAELPLITRPIMVSGDGVGQTQIYAGASYTGAHVLGFSELFKSSTDAPSNGFFYQIGQLDWGAGARGLTIFGNLTAISVPDAIVLYGRNTDMLFRDLECNTIGICISAGRTTLTQQTAYWRESTTSTIRSRGAGRAGKGVIDIDSVGAGGTANELTFFDLALIFPRANALRIVNHNRAPNTRTTINMRFFDLRAEALGGDPNSTGASLIQVGSPDDTSSVSFIDFSRVWLSSAPKNAASVTFTGISADTAPHDISFNSLDIGGGAPLGKGIDIEAGYNLGFELSSRNVTYDNLLTVAPSNLIARSSLPLAAGSTTTSIVLTSTASSANGSYVGNALVIPTNASITASFAGTTMTVSAVASGTVAVGQMLWGAAIPGGTKVTAFVSGTGGTGTYTLNNTFTLSSIPVAATLIEARLVTAYVGATRTATVGALQGSAAGFTTAPATGISASIDQLVGAGYLYFNGYGTEGTWTTSIGTGAAPYLLVSRFLGGSFATGALQTALGNTKFSGLIQTPQIASVGTKFTISGCTTSATVGGTSAGKFVSGVTGACAPVITMGGQTAPTGWACYMSDATTPANLMSQTASTATTATFTGTTAANDNMTFGCVAY